MESQVNIGYVTLKMKLLRGIWNVISCFLFFPFGTPLFNRWRVLLLKMFGAKVEWDSIIYRSAKIWAPWNLQMGHHACLGPNVVCYNQAMVTLEDDVTVSQEAYLCTASHELSSVNNPHDGLIVAPITLKRGSWVAVRAYVGMGVTIGEYAVVGATSSVYKSVEAYHVVGGNPARVIKVRNMEER